MNVKYTGRSRKSEYELLREIRQARMIQVRVTNANTTFINEGLIDTDEEELKLGNDTGTRNNA